MVDPETRPWPRIGRAHQPTLEGVAVHAGSCTKHADDVQLQRAGFEMAPVERHDHSSMRAWVGAGNLLPSQSCALREPANFSNRDGANRIHRPNNLRSSASSTVFTPSARAFSSFDPASAPTTT